MTGKKVIFILSIWILAAIFLSACGTEAGTRSVDCSMEGNPQTAQDAGDVEGEAGILEGTKESAADQGGMTDTLGAISELETILIEFPFPDEMSGYTLSLVPSKEAAGQYDLQVCNEIGLVVQQFLCGVLTEPITFRFDGLTGDGYSNLEIFSADSQTGMLFLFGQNDTDQEAGFAEQAVEIPRYDEIYGSNVMACRESAESVDKTIYQWNGIQKRMSEIRRWHMQKSTGTLEIWDCLEQRVIFEGKTELNEAWEPVNEAYYQFLFWNNIYLLGSWSERDVIPVWISGPDGNIGYETEYTDKQSLLREFHFGDEQPVYEAYDNNGNLSLELYVDETAGTAVGFLHEYYFTEELRKLEYLYGFTVDEIRTETWEERDPFDTNSVYGTDGADGADGADEVTGYEEILECREDGRPERYQSQGRIEWLRDKEDEEKESKDTILQISYLYRDDGTLYYRGYQHNSFMFGTTLQVMDSLYDESGRVCYEEGYITHGTLYYYFFYEDDERTPKYCLVLDDNLGDYIPRMIQYT